MAGWNLKVGELQRIPINEDKLWVVFNFVFSDASRKRNTYKFGLIKAILDNLMNCTIVDDKFVLYHRDIFAKFTESYWNLILKYHLKQMRSGGKSEYSRVEQILMQAREQHNIPPEVPFDSLHELLKAQIVTNVQNKCKQYVMGALYEDFDGIVYGFDLKMNYIELHPVAYQFMLKYKMELERLNYYAWAKFLEKVNDDNVLIRLLDKLELSLPQRNNLDVYRNILYKEFEEDTCFYCGKKFTGAVHVDHFIPWSFVKEDKLWNFVLACPTCNTRKNNKLPEQKYVHKLETRNNSIVPTSDFTKKQFATYQSNMISNLWQYAHYAGFKEFCVK